ncbi:MAG TPA: HDOD domain-containing protein [Acetomicrobium flavidum]|uniref:HDOD domain-containing protein n=1 Tax=Acetomicrobium flavidum TaxID=49896 RepID=UPI002D16FB7B|nr:HDOD domain-containing protein [Acetomicrobium flavidum]
MAKDESPKEIIKKRILKKVQNVPSLPQFVLLTLKKLDDERSSASDVASSLSKDQGLVVRVLRLANSAYYGIPRTITSVTEAVAILGFKTLRSIVLAASIYPFMAQSQKGYALDRGELWRHSLGVAYVSRFIGSKLSGVDLEEAYLAGLLHDIGKIVLNEYVRYGYSIISKIVEEKAIPFTEAEKEVLGFDHAEIGAMIIDQWALPEVYAMAAHYHHMPEDLPEGKKNYRTMVDVVHIANAMCLMLGFGLGADGLQHNISEMALERLNLKDKVEMLLSEAVNILYQLDEEIRSEEIV